MKASVLLIILSLLAFTTGLGSYFVSDDFVLIGKLAEDGYFASWGQEEGGFLRPLTTASLLIDYHLWGYESTGYHLVNTLLHAAASILLLLLARRLFGLWKVEHGDTAAFAAALLFAVLPSHVEPVSWISGRGDLLATTLALAATLAFLTTPRRAGCELRDPSRDKRPWLGRTAAWILFTGALMAKESIVVLPVIWLGIFLAHRRLDHGNDRSDMGPVLAGTIPILASYMVLRRVVLGSFVGGLGTARHLNILNLQSVENVFRYAVRVLTPPIGFFRSDPAASTISTTLVLMFAVLVVLILRAIIKKRIPRLQVSLMLILGALFLLSLLPVLSMTVSLTTTQKERYLYLPGVFACMLTGLALCAIFRSRRAILVATAALAVVSLIGLVQSARDWVAAGNLTESLSSQLSVYDPDSVVILNIPDNINGPYVFRNGLSEAATLFQGRTMDGRFRVLSTHSINSVSDETVVIQKSDRISITLPESCEYMMADSEYCHVEGNTAYFSPRPDLTVLYYRSGGLHQAQRQPER